MPTVPCELVRITTTIFIWQQYDPTNKADLFSSAIVTADHQVVVVDPIPLPKAQVDLLRQQGRITGVISTNNNHQRAVVWYSDQFSAPIFAHPASFPDGQPGSVISVAQGDKIAGELDVIEIIGAAVGEIALYHPANGGTFIVGDALINFAPHGFTFLPRKYCANQKQMRQSLRKLLDYEAERMLFAHGTPILAGATARLRQLLDVDL